VSWVEKLARQDWSAFQNGDLACIIAVARKRLWDELVLECGDVVDRYEQEYLRRICWFSDECGAEEHETGQTVHTARVVEKGMPDRVLFELRFDTRLPAIYYSTIEPFETSGVITLVLDEMNDVRFCYRGILMSAVDLSKTLLAPVLFRVNVYHPQLKEDLVDQARLRAAYGESGLLARGSSPIPPRRIHPRSTSSEVPKRKSESSSENQRAPWLPYVLAGSSVLSASGLLFLVQALTSVPIFWLLSGAIVFAFVQWGLKPGLCALAIGILSTDFFFVEPLYEISFNSTVRLLGLAYAFMAFSAYWLAMRRRTTPV
jgi:hypothetical protein